MFLSKIRLVLNKDIESEMVVKAVFALAGAVLGALFHTVFFYQILLNLGVHFFSNFFFLNVYKETAWYVSQIALAPIFVYLGIKLSFRIARQRKAILPKR